jgi:hypothetical protein
MGTTKKPVETVPEKNDSIILYPKQRINKYVVEPWGLFEISQIAPIILSISEKAKANGMNLTVDNCAKNIAAGLHFIYDDVIKIVAITVGDTEENIKKISPRSDGIILILSILYQNIEYLKDFFGLLPMVVKTIQSAA